MKLVTKEMNMWQQELHVQQQERNQIMETPPLRLVLNGEIVDITPSLLCQFPEVLHHRRYRRACVSSSRGLIVEAQILAPHTYARYKQKGYIQQGVRIDCCAPYILSALEERMGQKSRSIYRHEEYVLALIPHNQIYSLVHQICDEFSVIQRKRRRIRRRKASAPTRNKGRKVQ